jgi:hypothetical protein
LRPELLLGFGIYLEQSNFGFQLGRRLLKRWRHHFAGPAPGRPEINQQWNLVTLDMLFESGRCDFQRLSVKQRIVTFAALGRFLQTRLRDAVDRIAMWANYVQWVSHFNISTSSSYLIK